MQMFKAFLPYGGAPNQSYGRAPNQCPQHTNAGLPQAIGGWQLRLICTANAQHAAHDDEPVDLGECRLGLALYQRQDDPSNDLSTRSHSKTSFTRTSAEGGGRRELEDDGIAAEQR